MTPIDRQLRLVLVAQRSYRLCCWVEVVVILAAVGFLVARAVLGGWYLFAASGAIWVIVCAVNYCARVNMSARIRASVELDRLVCRRQEFEREGI